MAKKTTTAKTKSTAKRAPAKRPVKKTTRQKVQQPQSLKVSPETQPFLSFSPTLQTIYWAVFSLLVLIFGLWLIMINVQVQELYDQIDQNRAVQDELDVKLQEALESKKAKIKQD